MNTRKHLFFVLGLLYTALALGATCLVLPGLLPFLLGCGLASLLDPAVVFSCKKLHLSRRWAAAAILLIFLAILTAGGFFLLRRLWFELTLLSKKLPAWIALLPPLHQKLDNLIYRWTVAVSPDLRAVLQESLTLAAKQLTELISSLSRTLLEWLSNGIMALPRVALFVFTALLASYFFLSGKPALIKFFQKQIPARWMPRLNKTIDQLKTALGGWLKAQGILIAVTFLLLTTGFLLIKVDAAILLAAGIALLDALPVFGTGTVLFPWAVFCLLNGELRRGLSLVVLYAVLWLTRSLLEPKLIANRAGLHPLATLLAIYLGFSLFGVIGMLLAPLAAVLVAQLYAGGVLNFRKK